MRTGTRKHKLVALVLILSFTAHGKQSDSSTCQKVMGQLVLPPVYKNVFGRPRNLVSVLSSNDPVETKYRIEPRTPLFNHVMVLTEPSGDKYVVKQIENTKLRPIARLIDSQGKYIEMPWHRFRKFLDLNGVKTVRKQGQKKVVERLHNIYDKSMADRKLYRWPLRTANWVGRASAYPLYVPHRVWASYRQILREHGRKGAFLRLPGTFLRNNFSDMHYYLIASGGIGNPINLLVFAFLSQGRTGFLDDIEEELPKPSNMVFLDSHENGDPFQVGNKDYFEGRYAHKSQATYERVPEGGIEEAIAKLKEIADKTGPIDHLVLSAHGGPGKMLIAGELVDIEKLKKLPQARGIFAPGANIVLQSCLVARDGSDNQRNVGEDFLRTLASKLLDRGGTIHASTKVLVAFTPIWNPEGLGATIKTMYSPTRMWRDLDFPVRAFGLLKRYYLDAKQQADSVSITIPPVP